MKGAIMGRRGVFNAGVLAAAFATLVSFPSHAQLFAAIAPEARATAPGGSVTFFVSAINNTSDPLTACFPSDPSITSYQSVDATNQLTGTADTPVDIAAGATQGFLIVIQTSPQNSGGLAFPVRPQFDCAEAVSEPRLSGNASVLLTDPNKTFEVPDIIAIGVTPTADGVIRIQENAGTEVFATAAVNIGQTARVRVAGFRGALMDVGLSICETGPDGACLEPPSDTSFFVDFAGNEVKTFSVFANTRFGNGFLFNPDYFRVGIDFQISQPTGRQSVGRATAALTSPVPDSTKVDGLYFALVWMPDPDNPRVFTTQLLDLIVGPDGRIVAHEDNRFKGFLPPEGDFGGFYSFTLATRNETFTPAQVGQTGTILAPSSQLDAMIFGLNPTDGLSTLRQSMDLALNLTPRTSFSGILSPAATLTGDEQTIAQPINVQAAYATISDLETPLDQLVGRWWIDYVSGMPTRGGTSELLIDSNGEFEGLFELEFGVGTCSITGRINVYNPEQAVFGVELSAPTEETCPEQLTNGVLEGLGFVNSASRPVVEGTRMRFYTQDQEAPIGSSIALYLRAAE